MDLSQLEPQRHTEHPSRLMLESFAFSPNSLPANAATSAHVSGCSTCQRQVATMKQEREAFMFAHPPATVLAKLKQPQQRGPIWLAWASFAAVAAVLLAWLLVSFSSSQPMQVPPQIALKGGVRLEVLVSRENAPARPMPDGSPLRPGDVLRFNFTAPHDGYLFIANLDATGVVTRYYPQGEERSAPVRQGTRLLPGAIALDRFEGREAVVALFSSAPLSEADVRDALSKSFARQGDLLTPLDLPSVIETRLIHEKTAR